jgi:hypothetical protein
MRTRDANTVKKKKAEPKSSPALNFQPSPGQVARDVAI